MPVLEIKYRPAKYQILETSRKRGVNAAWNYLRSRRKTNGLDASGIYAICVFIGFILGYLLGLTTK